MSVAGRTGSHTSAFTASGEKLGSTTMVFTPLARSSAIPRPDSAVWLTEGWAPHSTTTSALWSGSGRNISCTALSAMDWSLPP